jgi:hypothetical protein
MDKAILALSFLFFISSIVSILFHTAEMINSVEKDDRAVALAIFLKDCLAVALVIVLLVKSFA